MTVFGKCFFEIPIYRCDQDQHTKEIEKERKNYIARRFQFAPKLPQDIEKDIRTQAKDEFNLYHWYPWLYNEIVGWIRLFADGTRIVGELWYIKSKAIRRRLVRKQFFHSPINFIELNFHPNDSSDVIFKKICTELKQLNSNRLLKKRYIDVDIFKTIGTFVNWRQLLTLKDLQHFSHA